MKEDRKIIFFDIDGTIYEPRKGVPDSTRRALERLKEKGHIPVICTGRPRCTVFPEITSLSFLGVIAGAGTYLEYQGQVLRDMRLSRETVEQALALLGEAGCPALLEGTEYLYYDGERDGPETFGILRRMLAEYPERLRTSNPEAEIGKITVSVKNHQGFEDYIPRLEELFTVIRYGEKPVAELVPRGMSKAQGIQALIKHLGIPWENTFAFGDGPNDREMLQYVRYGVAMGNSEGSVLAAAEYKTERMEQDGVWKALERFGLL